VNSNLELDVSKVSVSKYSSCHCTELPTSARGTALEFIFSVQPVACDLWHAVLIYSTIKHAVRIYSTTIKRAMKWNTLSVSTALQ